MGPEPMSRIFFKSVRRGMVASRTAEVSRYILSGRASKCSGYKWGTGRQARRVVLAVIRAIARSARPLSLSIWCQDPLPIRWRRDFLTSTGFRRTVQRIGRASFCAGFCANESHPPHCNMISPLEPGEMGFLGEAPMAETIHSPELFETQALGEDRFRPPRTPALRCPETAPRSYRRSSECTVLMRSEAIEGIAMDWRP